MSKLRMLSIILLTIFFYSCEKENKVEIEDDPILEQFAVDDGSKDLLGTTAQKFKSLILNVNPSIALKLGPTNITEQQFEEIKRFTDALVGKADEVSKFNLIFDWITKNVSYQASDNEPYSVFKNKRAICQGYANLLKVMLLSQKIPVTVVNGNISDGVAHAWNYVYLGGKWIISDPTNGGRQFSVDDHPTGPTFADIDLFEDEQFIFNYSEGSLNIKAVKNSKKAMIVPFGKSGYKVSSFNPSKELPDETKELYIGKNIISLGENGVGLNVYGKNIEKVSIEATNPVLENYNGVVYRKKDKSSIPYYIPAKLQKIEIKPAEVIEKNTIVGHNSVQEVIFAQGTQVIEGYAIENCPQLKKITIPKSVKDIRENAFFNVSKDVQIIRAK